MAFIYFEDINGDYTIINDRHLVYVDIAPMDSHDDGDKILISMDNGASAQIKKEMFVVDDFELAVEGVELLKTEKTI